MSSWRMCYIIITMKSHMTLFLVSVSWWLGLIHTFATSISISWLHVLYLEPLIINLILVLILTLPYSLYNNITRLNIVLQECILPKSNNFYFLSTLHILNLICLLIKNYTQCLNKLVGVDISVWDPYYGKKYQ